MNLILRQLQDAKSSTYTYLLADPGTREAILIDPVFEQVLRDSALLRELDLKLVYTLDTHVHADHVTGAWLHKQTNGSRIAISAAAGAEGADLELKPGDRIEFGERWLEARPTPGHTDGCMSYVLDDRSMVFTGDALLIRGAGRTDFQQGNASTLYNSVTTELFSLPDDCIVYPAHDYRGLMSSSIEEEKRFNPRLGGDRNESDFIGYMQNLGLAHPKQIDQAVPANKVCGHVATLHPIGESHWAPLRFTYAGIHEIEAEWVAAHPDAAQIVDVRETDEYDGPLGHIANARLIPLSRLSDQLDDLDRERPVVTVCRSGGRSAQAYVLLTKAGFDKVANLAGGMLHWRELHLPVA